jgi:hypothetical protein
MSILMHTSARLTQGEAQPVVRISKGHFASDKYDKVERLIRDSADLSSRLRFSPCRGYCITTPALTGPQTV